MAKAEYRSAIRSRRLINAALADLLLEKSLDKITVTDIVNRAQINRGTFYAHYSDVPDVIDHLIQQTFSKIRDVLDEKPVPLEAIPTAILQRVQDILEEDLDFYQKVMTSSASSLMQRQLVDTVLAYLFQHEEDFQFGNHEQYALTVRFCAGGLTTLYLDWFAGKIPCSLQELTKQAENMVRGIIMI